jgi:Tfp pilus assembly protein FimT
MQKFPKSGFTLVELSVMLVIITAILGMTAVGGVSLQTDTAPYKMRSQVRVYRLR